MLPIPPFNPIYGSSFPTGNAEGGAFFIGDYTAEWGWDNSGIYKTVANHITKDADETEEGYWHYVGRYHDNNGSTYCCADSCSNVSGCGWDGGCCGGGCYDFYDEVVNYTGWRSDESIIPSGVRWSPFVGTPEGNSSCGSSGCGCSDFSAPGFSVTFGNDEITYSPSGRYVSIPNSHIPERDVTFNIPSGSSVTWAFSSIDPQPDFGNYQEVDVNALLPPLPKNYEPLIVAQDTPPPPSSPSGNFWNSVGGLINAFSDMAHEWINKTFFKTSFGGDTFNQVQAQRQMANEILSEQLYPDRGVYDMGKGLAVAVGGPMGMVALAETATNTDNSAGERVLAGLGFALGASVPLAVAAKTSVKSLAEHTNVFSSRNSAFRQAKADSGIPRSQQYTTVGPNYDKHGKVIPGKTFHFPGGKKIIEEPGHKYKDVTQNRGPHFHDNNRLRHYDF